MNQIVVLEQDEQISTLGSNASFITALKDIDINLSNELFNSSSVISAQEDLTITANKVTNETDSVDTHDMYRLWGRKWVESWEDCSWHSVVTGCKTRYRNKTSSWTDTRSELAYSKDKGTLSAGQNLIINAVQSITNGDVIQSNEFLQQTQTEYQNNNAIENALATNGQFVINKPSAAKPYVIETRNEFVDLNKFKASQYLFARPAIRFLDPTIPNPMVMGDAYWEHEQLKKQIVEQTKKATLYAGYDMNATFERLFTQSNEEFDKLTNAGVDISFGVSLSKEAIKALTQEIVWYENEEVEINSEQYTALVPRFYLANATLDDLEKSPQAFFAAQNITLNSDGQVINQGQIAAENNTNMTASNIINQNGVMTGNNINLDALNVIINQSGDIKAVNDLSLTGQTVANIANEQTITKGRNTSKTIGNASTLEGKDITLNANDVINTASNINASNNLEIIANNLIISTQQNTTDLKAGGGSNYSNSQSTKHQTSNIDVVGDLSITADNINIQGAKVSANNANIKSNHLTLSSVQDSTSVQMQSKSSGGLFGGRSKSTSNSQKITHQGAELDIANNLTIPNPKIEPPTIKNHTKHLKKSPHSIFATHKTQTFF